MFTYGVNISMIFAEYPFPDRVQKVAEAGFSAFEFWFPSLYDMKALKEQKERFGLEVALFNLNTPPNMKGLLSNPKEIKQFRESLEEAVALAHQLGCKRINTLTGNTLEGFSREEQTKCALDNLRYAGKRLEGEGITLMFEALNLYDSPGYFLSRSQEGFRWVEEAASPLVKFQYDLYHMQLMEGNLLNTLRANLDKIGHIQIADLPGRHEPGTGEINYPFVLKALEEMGYSGYVNLEYIPSEKSEDSFAWLPLSARGRNR
ncbi:MAG: TIM barrel protein [bacterium]